MLHRLPVFVCSLLGTARAEERQREIKTDGESPWVDVKGFGTGVNRFVENTQFVVTPSDLPQAVSKDAKVIEAKLILQDLLQSGNVPDQYFSGLTCLYWLIPTMMAHLDRNGESLSDIAKWWEGSDTYVSVESELILVRRF